MSFRAIAALSFASYFCILSFPVEFARICRHFTSLLLVGSTSWMILVKKREMYSL